jgi:hypothetical protein
MNRWRVGEDRGSKEMDRCPLTQCRRTSWHHWGRDKTKRQTCGS